MSARSTTRRGPALEALGVLAVTVPLGLWEPAFWVLVPLVLFMTTRRSLDEYGVCWRLGPIRLHVATVAVVFGGYALAHALYAHLLAGAVFTPRLPRRLHIAAAYQVLNVAFPEEFFFRGYLQTRLNHACGRPFRTFGASWGWGLPAAAAIFALCHLVYGDVTQMKVFFFGLFAGWLRERTGSIATPILYHAAANILLAFLLASFD